MATYSLNTPEQILKQYWGYDHFRPLQKEIISSVLQKQDTLALLPTGGGKSICYQVPAFMQEGICLVISPLISLMQDQVARLKEIGIDALCIHAGMHYNEVQRTLENVLYGPYKLLYVSPERLQTSLFLEYLPEFNLSLIAVDEAHCISQWGQDFRPDYLKIASLKELFPEVPILALTASATTDVQQDIIRHLKLKKPQTYKQSYKRQNIYYEINYSENKTGDTIQNISNDCNIIYCRSRKQTEVLTKVLLQNSLPTVTYHAGLDKDKREEAQKAWMSDQSSTIVATNAFGMGIDKPNVRMVLHYDSPEHLEAYYQEAGRAGRDGQPARSLVLYNQTDIKRLEASTDIQFPSEQYLKTVYQAVVEYLQIPIGAEPDRYYTFELNTFCQRFGLELLPASHAIKLLEREGLWTVSDAVFHPPTIQFTATRQELDQLQQTYPDLGYVTVGLLRLYGTIFHYPTPVRIGAISYHLKLKKELVEQILVQLDKMEILTYNRPSTGSQLFFHHLRVDSKHLILDMQRIYTLREKHKARTDAMIHFLENEHECREKLLLSYFGEAPEENCGHCDICKKKAPNVNPRHLNKTVLALLKEHDHSLQELLQQFPVTIKEEIIALVRTMADEGIIVIHPTGKLSINE